MTNEEMLDLFFETNDFYLSEDKDIKMGLVPERLRGETATFDIKLGRKVIVEEGRRITAKHVRDMEKVDGRQAGRTERVPRGQDSRARHRRTPRPANCWPPPTRN